MDVQLQIKPRTVFTTVNYYMLKVLEKEEYSRHQTFFKLNRRSYMQCFTHLRFTVVCYF